MKNTLRATVTINLPISQVWNLWTSPAHIAIWNCPNDQWTNTRVENDLHTGKSFLFVMAKKDGSESFDFQGTYNEIRTYQFIAYTLTDGRKTQLTFTGDGPVTITENFEPVANLDLGMQQAFCQSVLERFKQYALSV